MSGAGITERDQVYVSTDATSQQRRTAPRTGGWKDTVNRVLEQPSMTWVRIGAVSIQFFLAGNLVFSKYALDYFQPMWFITLRIIFALPLLCIIGYMREGKYFIRPPLSKSEWGKMLALAMTGVTLNLTLVYWALSSTSAVNTAVIVGPMLPVLLTLMTVCIGWEKFHWTMIIGGGLAVAGACVVIGIEHMSFESEELLANIILLFAATDFAIYLLLLKRFTKTISPLRATFWAFAIGLVFILLIALVTTSRNSLDNEVTPTYAWLAVFYAAFIGTGYVYIVNAWTFKHGRGTEMALYVTLVPVITALLELAMGNGLSPRAGIGGVLVIAGLVVVKLFSRPLADDVVTHPGDHSLSMLEQVHGDDVPGGQELDIVDGSEASGLSDGEVVILEQPVSTSPPPPPLNEA